MALMECRTTELPVLISAVISHWDLLFPAAIHIPQRNIILFTVLIQVCGSLPTHATNQSCRRSRIRESTKDLMDSECWLL